MAPRASVRTAVVRRRRRTLLAGLALTAVLTGTTTGTALADSSPAPAPTGDGSTALCKRVPRIEKRIDRALTRLDAGAGTRGSVARLQARVDNAKQAGHDAVATYLQDRLDFRKKLPATLRQRKQDLADVRTWCKDNGITVGKG
ncbi:hypothetical protein WN71_011695 [Streptomyces mangrovisoli]|uniref:Haemophore haem-binding domain-containing protein n=2 Tax=Streptomyces mangrovisoli TaxID=1428628 RepID=A0A1J4P1Y9_9ACTN|nr:hypothetical protein WN71_011695 [Streptomyces mangrovisoli]